MTSTQLFRISGVGLLVAASAFIVHILLRSVITASAGGDTATFAKESLWMPINALGVMGAALVLLGLPAMYVRIAQPTGWLGLVGVVLLALGWMFQGLFLSLFGLVVAPWLAVDAPSLVSASAALPVGFVSAFIVALTTEVVGILLLAIPFLRGRVQPRWLGYVLLASALLTVGGDFIAPGGPATNVVINLISNSGPVFLLIGLGYLGSRMWSEPAPV